MNPVKIGLMGFGRVGRQIFQLALADRRFEVVAISDIGEPKTLHYLLSKTVQGLVKVELAGNYLIWGDRRARLMPADHPNEIPWDVFDVDVVVDATGTFRRYAELVPHLENGAPRVITSALPEDEIDRVILFGVNDADSEAGDRVVSAGSASTTATALLLKSILSSWPIEQASMTSVHAYTSDQSLQDYAGPDIRRSRSGAENIIPNSTPAKQWVQRALPVIKDRFSAYALNVPVQVGSMLDVTLVLEHSGVELEAVNNLFEVVASEQPRFLQATRDPIVSSDVRGTTQSLIVDLDATMKAGNNMFKLIGWHETLGHAQRILDVAGMYAGLDLKDAKEVSS